MEKLPQKTIDCATSHIKALFEQAAFNEPADFGEPCEGCEYAIECKLDWLTALKPLLDQSNVKIKVGFQEGIPRTRNTHHVHSCSQQDIHHSKGK